MVVASGSATPAVPDIICINGEYFMHKSTLEVAHAAWLATQDRHTSIETAVAEQVTANADETICDDIISDEEGSVPDPEMDPDEDEYYDDGWLLEGGSSEKGAVHSEEVQLLINQWVSRYVVMSLYRRFQPKLT